VLIGCALLALAELVLWAVGAGDFRDRPDPFAGFSRLRRTFEARTNRDQVASYVAIDGPAPTRQFLARKPPNGFRVFVFGGSTEAGTPYGYDYAFAELLRRQLGAALPMRHVEVINLAKPGYGSRRLLYLAEEVAVYEPDLFVISTGHNEFIDQRVYAHLFDRGRWLFAVQQRLLRLRLYVLLGDLLRMVRGTVRPELDGSQLYVPMFGANLRSEAWKDEYERDPEAQRFFALAMFRNNVDRMIRIGQEAGASVLLLSQSKNYADWPVTQSAHRRDLTPQELRDWQAHLAEAERARQAEDTTAELRALQRAAEVDGHWAALHQRLAEIYRARGDAKAAREHFRLAHNLTLDSFGTTPARNEVLHELAQQRGTLWLDVDRIFEEASPEGLVGFNLFADFLHPNLAGHQLIARRVFELLRAAGVPEPPSAWRTPPPLPDPAEVMASNPRLKASELGLRIAAELVSGRRDAAEANVRLLRELAPDDERLPQLERWVDEGVPEELRSSP